YELIAESCIPGIQTTDWRSIFEEQSVISSLTDALNERQQGTEVCFVEEGKVFSFGSVVSSQNPAGVCERFKISNNNKIPCTVTDKDVGNRNDEGGADASAFVVQPEVWEIPPHEHRYVSTYFRPTEMRSYRAKFDATVANNDSEPSTGRLEFLLAGKGTMPTVTLEKPIDRDQTGAVMMNFGEVRLRIQTASG
ncbi:unnamed protein product, partial [Choristocarpus tenellus]